MIDRGETIGDSFDLFDPLNIRPSIKYPDGFIPEEHNPILTKLFNKNQSRREQGEIVNGTPVIHTTNVKIAAIYQELLAKDNLLSGELTDGDLAESILRDIETSIGDDTFNSRTPSDQFGNVELEDVEAFLEIL